jgi:hypothetical protein
MHFHQHPDIPYPRRRHSVALHIAAGIVFGAALVFVFGFVITHLWNAIMPGLVHASTITFWHSIGLLFLARILVGGFHRGHGFHRRPFMGHGARRDYEDWWQEVGRHSYDEFAASRVARDEQK